MSEKSKFNVFNKMTKTALDEAYPKFSKSPEDAKEQLKKNLEEQNMTRNIYNKSLVSNYTK